MVKRRIQSLINHTDACSTGNKEAGLVNSFSFARIPRSVLKSKTSTKLPKPSKDKCCGSK